MKTIASYFANGGSVICFCMGIRCTIFAVDYLPFITYVYLFSIPPLLPFSLPLPPSLPLFLCLSFPFIFYTNLLLM